MSFSVFSILVGVTVCAGAKSPLSGNDLHPPRYEDVALMARFIIHNSDWLTIATISSQKSIEGFPFVTLKSLSDGPLANSTGIPFLYMTDMDVSGQDILKNNNVTVMATLAESNYCTKKNYDPQDPRCAKVIISGQLLKFAVLQPLEEGLKVTIDEKCVETSAYIPSNMFLSYHISDVDNIIFRINLKTFTDTLNIFGDDSNSTVKLTFRSLGSPLCLLMSHGEENITVDCEIKTMNSDDFDNPSLSDECNLNKVVVAGNIFHELLQRLDNSAEDLKISFSPGFPYFNLKSTSLSGESEVSLNKNCESVHSFSCKETTDFTYAFSNVRHIIKVLHYASRVAISTGNSGLLGLQLIITADDNQMYVEYYVTAQYERP